MTGILNTISKTLQHIVKNCKGYSHIIRFKLSRLQSKVPSQLFHFDYDVPSLRNAQPLSEFHQSQSIILTRDWVCRILRKLHSTPLRYLKMEASVFWRQELLVKEVVMENQEQVKNPSNKFKVFLKMTLFSGFVLHLADYSFLLPWYIAIRTSFSFSFLTSFKSFKNEMSVTNEIG